MRSRIRSLFKLWYNPLQAMADIASGAPYFVGVLLAFAAYFLYRYTLSGELAMLFAFGSRRSGSLFLLHLLPRIFSSLSPVLFLAVVFVPACLIATNLVDRRASFGVLLRQEYAPLAACVLYSWAAAHLMMLVAAHLSILISTGGLSLRGGPGSEMVEAALGLMPLPYFVFLVVLALRVALRLTYGQALGAVAMGAISLVALPLLSGGVLFLLSSPLLAILALLLLRNFFSEMLSAQQARENFKQNMEAATLNPADASAHYNLGLIYQQRGQYQDAKTSFRRAIEIDPDEVDSHYQLGRIARQEGDLSSAIAHFDAVVRRDSDHSQSEVWREIGRTYLQAGQFEDARRALERFLEKRESDAEGRYFYGLTLNELGRKDEALTEMRACIEAVRRAPAYKYRTEKRWMSEAQTFLRSH